MSKDNFRTQKITKNGMSCEVLLTEVKNWIDCGWQMVIPEAPAFEKTKKEEADE